MSSLFKDQEKEKFDWRKEWLEMPEYSMKDNSPYKEVLVKFRDQEAITAFMELIKQNITMKTKSIWFPEVKNEVRAKQRWVEKNES